MESVGFDFPAKDEILVIDRDTKNITAPIGYNNVICNYGEKGLSKVYFLINRHIGKNREFDIYNSETGNVAISLYIAMTGEDETVRYAIDSTNISKQLYIPEINNRNSEGLVLLTWDVPDGITCGTIGPGKLEVALEFALIKDTKPEKKWITNTYKELVVGNTLMKIVVTDEETGESGWLTTDAVTAVINNYFQSLDNFIIDGNK
jgi:hypothetical protein